MQLFELMTERTDVLLQCISHCSALNSNRHKKKTMLTKRSEHN